MIKLCHCLIPLLLLASPALAVTDEPPAAAAGEQYFYQLSYADAEEAIAHALGEKGVSDKVAALINGRKNEPLFSYNKPVSVEIRGLQFDKMTRKWNASLLVLNGADVITAMPVAGRFEAIVEVPVLKRDVKNGSLIEAADIEIKDFPASQTRPDMINDMSSLIGKTPVRTISRARPVREHEIASPAVVKKNGIVQMNYITPGMQISATGQALVEGAVGDVIEVRNTSSRKTVRAVVADAHSVTVMGPGVQTSQLTGAGYDAN